MKMKRGLIFLLIAAICCFTLPRVSQAAVNYSSFIQNETNWIAGLQLPSGAIPASKTSPSVYNGVTSYWVEPYFANMAVIGMLESNPSSANVAASKKWFTWYFNHLNSPDYNALNGTVYDYYVDVSSGAEMSSQQYDSTDSYGATFISALKQYYVATNDGAFLTANRSSIELIANAVLATQQADGLTFAKPDYAIKYLMDNSEVYEGLLSMEWLEREVFKDSVKANTYQTKKDAVRSGIESLWNSTDQDYYMYAGGPAADWNTFYADAVAQLYPIWEGLISPSDSRAQHLYDTFNSHYPNWPTLSTPDQFPWAIIAYTAALMGDTTRTDTFLTSIQNTYSNTGRNWPYYDLEAGFSVRAANVLNASQVNLALNKAANASSLVADAPKSVDGNTATRWGSSYADNQWYSVDLGSIMKIDKVKINWEAAYDTVYSIQVSSDNVNYTTVYSTSAGDGGIDTISFDPVTARYVKILCTTRATPYGSSFWEFEVYGNPVNTVNYALNKSVTASSLAADAPKSVDGDLSTRWGSSYVDNQWYKVDLGADKSISKVIINWEAAYDTQYAVQVSSDDVNYTTVYSTTTGDGGIDTISFSPTTARYVKLLCTMRATPYGSSFWEFEVY